MLDVRKPIGYLFVLIGAILTAYGVVAPQVTKVIIEATREEVTLNLDLPCGACMFAFGALMLGLALVDARKAMANEAKREAIKD